MSDPEQIRFKVVHADDHVMFRQGVRKLLEGMEDIDLVAEAGNGRELAAILKSKPCDLLILDLSMPGTHSLKLIEKFREESPAMKIMALTMHREREYFQPAIARGIDGYVLKDDVFEVLIQAIRNIMNGNRFYSGSIQGGIIDDYETIQRSQATLDILTKREIEILSLIAEGNMNKEIADRLFLSVRTVESHRSRIMRKLKVYNVQGLVRFAVRNALI